MVGEGLYGMYIMYCNWAPAVQLLYGEYYSISEGSKG